MKTYEDCKWSFLKPTEKQALYNITKSIEKDETLSIIDLENLGCLTTNGNLKKQWANLFKMLHIKTGFEEEL